MTDLNALHYTAEHEWIRIEGDVAVIGITDYAAEKLGDVVFVELPKVGAQVTAGQVCGEIESTKSVGELYAPVTGEVIERNEALSSSPETVNADPFGEAWMIKVKFSSTGEFIDRAAYEALTV